MTECLIEWKNMKKMLTLLTLFFFTINIYGQSAIPQNPNLDQKFKEYTIIQTSTNELMRQLSSSTRSTKSIEMKIDDNVTWDLELEDVDLFSDNYTVFLATDDGVKVTDPSYIRPMKGKLKGQDMSQVSLTFADNFIFGFIRIGFTEYFVEPVYHFDKSAPVDQFVVYSVNDIINETLYTCGYENTQAEKQRVKSNTNIQQRMPGACFRVDYSFASDFSMVSNYGTAGTQNHNIGVLNNVQTNYDTEFADNIQFFASEQFLSTSTANDPWTTSTDAGTLLNSFTNWAPSGFTLPHDLASIWTRRDLDGSTIGIAWVGVLCTANRYNVLQDFTSNAAQKRVLMAHEIGHNFNANHDASGSSFIMAPAVSSSTSWSTASINSIQAEYLSAWCLDPCQSVQPPTASFNFNIVNPCAPSTVQFTNTSTGGGTRLWSFPGGNPATSTANNPVVTYANPGVYDVSLTVTNSAGSNTFTLPTGLTILGFPSPEFIYSSFGSLIAFNYTGSPATTYLWRFGNGATSVQQNPSHIYARNGTYNVTVRASNVCGSDSITYPIPVSFAPTPRFVATNTTGCQPLIVQYTNNSTNADSYIWSFPGGSPATSTDANPTVTYSVAGIYNTSLVAVNDFSSVTETKTNFVTISPNAIPSFTLVQSGAQVTFTNTSQFANTYVWNFGDGTTSTVESPTKTYSANGTYTVTLSATNSCGIQSTTQTVTVALAPVATYTSSSTDICSGETITFTSTSSGNPTSYLWTFAGGDPSTSTSPNPTILYDTAGTYGVTLTVTNAFGTSTVVNADTILVKPQPVANFTFIADGFEVNFINVTPGATNILWNFGDGTTSTMNAPTHIYATQGTYNTSLTATTPCGSITITKSVIVQLAPTAGFIANVTTACNPASITFTSQSSPSATVWNWTFPGGTPATSILQNPTVTYANAGKYDVTLSVTNAAGTGTLTETNYINIITVPTTGFDVDIQGSNVELTNTGMGATSTSWEVIFGADTLRLTGNVTSFVPTQNGERVIIQTNTNSCGSTISTARVVNVDIYPEALLGGVLTTCANQSYTFANNSSNAASFEWTFAGADTITSGDRNPTVVYNEAGTYPVMMVASNSLGNDTLETFIIVSSDPTSTFTQTVSNGTATYIFTGSSSTNVRWDFGDGTTGIGDTLVHTYTTSGTYTVVAFAQNGCGTDTSSQIVTIMISAVNDISFTKDIIIYPNPIQNDLLNIKMLNSIGNDVVIGILDVFGKVLISQQVNIDKSGMISLDVQHLLPATYFVRIVDGSQVAFKAIIKQ